MKVAVVTDSTAYLPAAAAQAAGVRSVPLHVTIGGVDRFEGVDVGADEVAQALQAYTVVSTARPSPQAFLDAYEAAVADGAEAIVSVHISAAMSSTIQSAQLAAAECSVPVEVVDSRLMAMAMGFAVLDAAAAAQRGASLEEVARMTREDCAASSGIFYVDTLEYLRRGGRIGAASAFLGSALAIKPILSLQDGQISPLEKVRTTGRALARLEELAVEAAAALPAWSDRPQIAVHHLGSPEKAAQLVDRLAARVPDAGEILLLELGAVVGAHVGPGTLAVVVAPSRRTD
ncbi:MULTISPECIES: DegV family protein [unclassified Janibacter]|uniref:DegV family protein n=1 Tax=unclassified Janibacter TaxID=2649294 RepID=UPI003D05D624